MRRRISLAVPCVLFLGGSLALASCTQRLELDEAEQQGPLASAFAQASAETGVPERLLLAVGYVETRWQTPEWTVAMTRAGHGARGTRGLMGVVDRADAPWFTEEVEEIDVAEDFAANDGPTNVRVAAGVLAKLAREELGEVPQSVAAWRNVLARYGAEQDPVAGHAYADEVLRLIGEGVEAEAEGGELLRLVGDPDFYAPSTREQGLDYPGVTWLPAREGHFTYGRTSPITHIIIHTTQGSYQSTLGWFRSAANPYRTSTHYVIRSWDGDITQMVREWNTGHHIGGWNPFTIGIEHEGFIEEGYRWFTDEMYRSSAALVRSLCLKYGIPMNRDRIRGHVEVPGAAHTDPGNYWDWDYYMELVRDPNTTAPAPGGNCDGLSYAGECSGETLRYCDGGQLVSVSCAARGETCGWQDDAVGYNCVEGEPADPCDGLDYAGQCDGDTLRYCQSDEIVTVDCAGRGEVCAWQSDDLGNNCVEAPADPCEGLDYAGECNGEMLRYCENDDLVTVNCAAREQVCEWESDTIGNNCVEPPSDPCEGLDYSGECSGQTLRWCEEGQLRSVDCAGRGQVCGWQSAAVGNNCL